MPELPEVETVRRGLEPALSGARLARVRTTRPDLRFPFPDKFEARLQGARVEALERRAKYLLGRLDTGETWVTHLGMTGRFVVEQGLNARALGEFVNAASTDEKHAHLIVETDGGRAGHLLRRPSVRLHGPDPYRRAARAPLVQGAGARAAGPGFRRGAPEARLCGQEPEREGDAAGPAHRGGAWQHLCLRGPAPRADLANKPAGKLTGPALGRLETAVREVLEAAIEAGGSTLRDYAHTDGSLGYFQHSFSVYGREAEACPREDGGVVRRIVQGGRSTFFCPVCQR
jgi:formamidopyrimidine-DNA glycosylase